MSLTVCRKSTWALLDFRISIETTGVIPYMLFILFPFKLLTFFLLFCMFTVWITTYNGELLFQPMLFGVLYMSYNLIVTSFFKLEKFSSITLLKLFSMPLTWVSFLTSILIINKFCLFIVFLISWIIHSHSFF